MSAEPREAVVNAIRDHGPISFAEYMELALYGPGGYYERPPVGPAGDFVTSPHVHPIFATLLATGIRQIRDALGGAERLRLAEVGAGDGTLARQLIEELPDIDYTAVERSAGARGDLSSLRGVNVTEALPEDAQVILAHELLDNLPFRRVRMTDRGPLEVRVGLDEGRRLIEVMADAGEDGVGLEAGAGLAPGEETVIPDGANAFVESVAAALRRGYALVIDYGAVGAPGGGAHGYRSHREVDIPLDDPGTTDITAGVDFAWIARRAEASGLVAFPSVTQFAALKALGFEAWARAELRRQHELLEARDAQAVRAWSARSRATLLVDPAALGRFRWLLLATPGLPAPTWLEEALASP
jgi:NADH dehydrogenase [ubiquinone] 1 alpha subcomplex assembly factor 7